MLSQAVGPKYLLVASQIEAQIHTGKWDGGRMPSVRGVAELHGVSAVTASRALQVLRDKGLIRTVERSGCYRLPPPDAECWAIVLHDVPLPFYNEGFNALARKEPLRWYSELGLKTELPWPLQMMKAKEAGVQGVILFPSLTCDKQAEQDRELVAACQAASLCVVLMGSDLRGHTGPRVHDLICVDYASAVVSYTELLVRTGRQKIALVIASPISSHNDMVAGYLAGMHRSRGKKTENAEIVVVQHCEKPSEDSNRLVMDQLQRAKVDAVICYSEATAQGLCQEARTRGLTVPKDLAIVGFEDGSPPISGQPKLSMYALPMETLAEYAVQLLRHRVKYPNRGPVKVLVPTKLIERESA